jgi:hypothetical protein
VYSRFGDVFVILNILLQGSIPIDRENVAVACKVIEWVSIDIIRGFFCC